MGGRVTDLIPLALLVPGAFCLGYVWFCGGHLADWHWGGIRRECEALKAENAMLRDKVKRWEAHNRDQQLTSSIKRRQG